LLVGVLGSTSNEAGSGHGDPTTCLCSIMLKRTCRGPAARPCRLSHPPATSCDLVTIAIGAPPRADSRLPSLKLFEVRLFPTSAELRRFPGTYTHHPGDIHTLPRGHTHTIPDTTQSSTMGDATQVDHSSLCGTLQRWERVASHIYGPLGTSACVCLCHVLAPCCTPTCTPRE